MRPSVSVTYFCAFAASRSENVCASSASVLTRSMALLNSSIALSKFPLKQREDKRILTLIVYSYDCHYANMVKNKITCPHAADYVPNKKYQLGSRICSVKDTITIIII